MMSEQVLTFDNKQEHTSERDEELELFFRFFTAGMNPALSAGDLVTAGNTAHADAYYKLCQIPKGIGTDKY